MSFKEFAKTPPMGWNSWDCFGAGVTEKELIENANFMHKHLQKYGYEYIVCDIQWYEPTAKGNEYKNFAPLMMDKYGRLLPAVNRFPSAGIPNKYYIGIDKYCVDNFDQYSGFKQISDYVHSLNLKFGIHIMRGIPRQAVVLNTPIKNSKFSAREIAHPFSVCSWNTDMYGLKNCQGAQDYYDSIISMYASWGVDFIKCDDIAVTEFSKYNDPYSADYEIEMIRKAIDKTKREIVLSLSPGPAAIETKAHLAANANMWRLTGDLWDRWDKLKNMFSICERWQNSSMNGNWPDCDMLPIGVLCKGGEYMGKSGRRSNFTLDELQTMLTLWAMFGSPLMIGGNLPEMTETELELLTNKDIININQNAKSRRLLPQSTDYMQIWQAEVDNDTSYIAYFNLSDDIIILDDICSANKFDVWQNKKLVNAQIKISPHAVLLLKE